MTILRLPLSTPPPEISLEKFRPVVTQGNKDKRVGRTQAAK